MYTITSYRHKHKYLLRQPLLNNNLLPVFESIFFKTHLFLLPLLSAVYKIKKSYSYTFKTNTV